MSVSFKNANGIREESYVGCVLCTRERNYPDDSDFYAVVWDEEKQTCTEVVYDTTRSYMTGQAVVDATPEVKAKAGAWLKAWAIKRLTEEYNRKAEQVAREIAKGDQVRVVRGRKVPKGTEGTVFWKGERRYGVQYARHGFSHGSGFYGDIVTRVGFKDAQGTVFWTNETNLEKVGTTNPQPMAAEVEAKIQAEAQVAVDHNAYHWPFAMGHGIAVVA